MCPNYSRHGKILTPLSEAQFAKGMTDGYFAHKTHRAFPVCIYYSAVRTNEARRSIKEQYDLDSNPDFIMFDVGPRLKKIRRKFRGKLLSDRVYLEKLRKRAPSITTPPLPLPKNAPFMDELIKRIEATEPEQAIFPFSDKTAYNIIDRVFFYPHHFRLSRITWFFMPHPEVNRPRGFSIPEVRSFTGLSLGALDYYIGLADVADMGRAMYLDQRTKGVNE